MSDTPPPSTALAIFLAEHDVPCPNPKCGFNLRGLKDAMCPECQGSLTLSIRRPEALWFMRRWVVAAVACIAISTATSAISWTITLASDSSVLMAGFHLWVYVGMSFVGVIAWLGVIVLYIRGVRRGNPRALPQLLLSMCVGLCLINSTYTLIGTWNTLAQIFRGY